MIYDRVSDFFRTGWRPAMGWVFTVAVLHEFVLRHYFKIASGDAVQLVAMLAGAGGLAGLRAWEKAKGQD